MTHLLVPLALSFAAGMVLGLERELSHKPAGLRTQVLVTLGTTLFMLTAVSLGENAARLAANIITGLGFIGAGVIWQQKSNVRGLTTAALIWVNGAIGIAIGLNQYLLAGLGVLFTLVALRSLSFIEVKLKSKCHVFHYQVRAKSADDVLPVIHQALQSCHFQEEPLTYEKNDQETLLRFSFCNPPPRHQAFVDRLRKVNDVLGVKVE